jgi:hypothetical protein
VQILFFPELLAKYTDRAEDLAEQYEGMKDKLRQLDKPLIVHCVNPETAEILQEVMEHLHPEIPVVCTSPEGDNR